VVHSPSLHRQIRYGEYGSLEPWLRRAQEWNSWCSLASLSIRSRTVVSVKLLMAFGSAHLQLDAADKGNNGIVCFDMHLLCSYWLTVLYCESVRKGSRRRSEVSPDVHYGAILFSAAAKSRIFHLGKRLSGRANAIPGLGI
jgi:hypothetical protein